MRKLKNVCVTILFLALCLSLAACSDAGGDSGPVAERPAPPAETPVEEYLVAPIEDAAALVAGQTALIEMPDSVSTGSAAGTALPPTGMPNPPSWPAHLPQHVPGSIRLHPDIEGFIGMPFPAQHRYVFYNVPGEISDLVGDWDAVNEWSSTAQSRDRYPDEMRLMLFVQHFNISQEDFVAAIEDFRTSLIAAGVDLYDELNELPNADIIFTFDNYIIRYFYRRV